MTEVELTRDALVVHVQGMDQLWALKSRLEIPLAHVRGATHDPGMAREPKGVRVGGTHFPGVITAGRFRRDGERLFWDVKNPDKTVVIELAEAETYDRLVVEVDDPRATVALVERSVARD